MGDSLNSHPGEGQAVANTLVVGAGHIGGLLASRLVDRGDNVTVATRSGTRVDGARSLVLDASDAEGFVRAATQRDTIFLCSNPPYHQWVSDWPPIFASAISAAQRTGARLVIMGNLYAYGTPTGPMTEHSPFATTETKGIVRRNGWLDALAAHERGEIQAVEVRASDYFGPGSTGTAHLGEGFFRPLLASKTARVVGDPAAAHSWSYLPDIVTTLIAASDYTGEWGRAWHVPSNDPLSRNQIVDQVDGRWHVTGRAKTIPPIVLRTMGLFSPLLREVSASSYQFAGPFIIDSTETEAMLGVTATAWSDALGTTVESYRRPR
jgi:nucleoside-diphosphate-sugar epimerase